MMRRTGWVCLLADPGDATRTHRLRGFVAWYENAEGRYLIHRLAGADELIDGRLPFSMERVSVTLVSELGYPPERHWPRARLVRTDRQLGRLEEYEIRDAEA